VFAGFGAAAIAAYFGGSFAVPFYISAVLCAIAAVFSILVLKPLIRSRIAHEQPATGPAPVTVAVKEAEHAEELAGVR
jgi:hypothetical protein